MKEPVDWNERGPLVTALMILTRQNVPVDVQELLLNGNPMLKVAPGALAALVEAIRADEAAKVREECVCIADEYNAPDRFKVSDEWKAEMAPSEVYNTGATDAAIWIAQAIRAKGPNMGELSGISGKLMDDAQDTMKRLRSGEDGLEYAAADILEAMSIAPVFAALRASQAEIARLRKALLAAYAALDNGAEREDVKDDIHAALKGEPG